MLLIDLSGSTDSKRDLIRKTTRRFIESARPSDRVAIVLAEESGGLYYKARNIGELNGVYEKVIDDLGKIYSLVEIGEFKTREYNPSFVLMQYFGYLRSDPEQPGYDFWLDVLNNKLSNDSSGYRAMVCAFVTSGEYQLRFGSLITHTDHDCQ